MILLGLEIICAEVGSSIPLSMNAFLLHHEGLKERPWAMVTDMDSCNSVQFMFCCFNIFVFSFPSPAGHGKDDGAGSSADYNFPGSVGHGDSKH